MKQSIDDYQRILADLQRVREAGVRVFGSDSHGFEMNSVMSEAEVRAFESKHKIKLPEDYRLFLLHVGRGGAGPAYGLFNLGEMDKCHDFAAWKEGDGFVGKLAAPFPYDAPWNDLTGRPSSELAEKDEDEYYRLQEQFERRYFCPTNGAIPICHLGCALRQWLVVSGKEAGHVWNDNTADYKGFEPESDRSSRRVSFFRWYRRWLDEAVAILKRSS